jgi:FlaA1/EpsC-like NDP-sugar epimerase
LVIGAAGSIGSELCRQVVGYGPERLLALDINESGLHNLWLELGKEIDVIIADIRDAARMDQIFEQYRPEAIYHAAAYKHVPLLEQHPSEGFRTNVVGTQTLVEAAARYKAECMIFVSSDKAVYARNVLGASKRVGELVVQSAAQRFRASETVFAAVRFGNVLGSRGSVVPTFERQIQRGGPVTVTDPRMTRYFMSIPEAVSLVLQASVYARGGEIFVLDMGTPMRIDELARRMIRLKGLRPGVDIQIEYIGMRPGETLTEELWHPDYEALAPTANPAILCVRDTGSAVNPAALAAEIEKMEQMIGLGQKEQLKTAMYVLSQGTSYKRTTPLSQPAGSTETLPRSDSVPGSAEPALRPA